jgi:hypothetical protein
MRRDCFHVVLFSLAVTISTATAQETTSPAASGAIGTGVGVSGNFQVDNDPFQFGDEDEPLLRPVRDTLRSEPLFTDYIEKILDAPL